jgi:hypothetical protein
MVWGMYTSPFVWGDLRREELIGALLEFLILSCIGFIGWEIQML